MSVSRPNLKTINNVGPGRCWDGGSGKSGGRQSKLVLQFRDGVLIFKIIVFYKFLKACVAILIRSTT